MAEVVIRGTQVDFGSKFFCPRGATPGLETNRLSGSKLGSGSLQHLIRIPYQGSTPVQGRGRKGEAELPCKHSKASSDPFGVVFPLSVHLEWQLWDLDHPRKYRLSVFTNPVPPCQAQRKTACHNCRSQESNQDACDSISFKSLWFQLRPVGQLPQKYLKDFCEDS